MLLFRFLIDLSRCSEERNRAFSRKLEQLGVWVASDFIERKKNVQPAQILIKPENERPTRTSFSQLLIYIDQCCAILCCHVELHESSIVYKVEVSFFVRNETKKNVLLKFSVLSPISRDAISFIRQDRKPQRDRS